MISIICFFIPIVLYLVTFPLKVLIKTLELRLKLEERKSKGSLLSRLENWADTEETLQDDLKNVGKGVVGGTKLVGKASFKTVKVAGKGVKLTYKTSKFAYKNGKRAVKMTIKAIKLTIRALKFTLMLIKSLVYFLLSLGVVGIIILIVIVLFLVVVCATAILSGVSGSPHTGGSGGINGSFSGYNYMSIDWNQDFTAKLSEIESTYGATNRHHAELVVLNMRLLKENPSIKLDPATWIGIKRIESGTEVFNDTSSSVFTSYTTLMKTNNGFDCFGPYQIQLPGSRSTWVALNEKYTPTNSPTDADTSRTGGNPFFYPDLNLGTSTAYSTFIDSWLEGGIGQGTGYKGMMDDLKQCFADVGVEYTEERARTVLEFYCANVYNVGHLNKLTGDIYNTLSKLYILFFNTYGWERNEAHVKLIKSAVNAGEENTNIYVKTDPQTTWVWGAKASHLKDDVDVGVLDKDGNKINKTLYGYLSSFDSNVASKVHLFEGQTGVNEATVYYGVACYFIGTWEIEKTIDYLGLRSQMTSSPAGQSDGTIVGIAKRESEAQGSERITYQLGGNGAYKADCSRYVASVLVEAGYDVFGIKASNHKGYLAHDDKSSLVAEASSNGGGVDCASEIAWVRNNQSQAIIYDGGAGGFDISVLQPGDITYRGNNHTTIYMGVNSKGEHYISHASSPNPNEFSCSDDANDLGKTPRYGFGYGRFEGYHKENTTFIFRPSLLK